MAAGLALAGCGDDAGSGDADSLTIPHLVSTTGPAAPYKSLVLPVTEMAVEEFNRTGGINGRDLVTENVDSRLDPTQAVRDYQQLPDDTIAIMGPQFATEFSAVAPLANREGIPIVTGLASDINIARENRPWVFMAAPSVEGVVDDALKTLLEVHPDIERVAMLVDEQDVAAKAQSAACEKALAQAGIEVVEKLGFQTGQTDFAPLAAQVQSANPDAVIVAALAGDSVGAVETLRRRGVDVPITVTQSSISTTEFTDNLGEWAGEVYGISSFWAGDPRARDFVQAYRKRADGVPSIGHVWAYEAWLLLGEALKQADTRDKSVDEARQAVGEALRQVSAEGVMGRPIRFSEDGFIDAPGVLLQIGSDGKITKAG